MRKQRKAASLKSATFRLVLTRAELRAWRAAADEHAEGNLAALVRGAVNHAIVEIAERKAMVES